MKSTRTLLLLASLVLAPLAGAQTAALKADNPHLAPSGGTLALTATLTYEGAPGAIGWSVELPADWSLVSVAGQTPPQIAPEAGTRGTLEFAFTEAPAARAEFTIVVRYPASAPSFSAKPLVILRQDGQLSQLKPAPVAFVGDDTPRQRTRDSQN
jgi:hypothetical protein